MANSLPRNLTLDFSHRMASVSRRSDARFASIDHLPANRLTVHKLGDSGGAGGAPEIGKRCRLVGKPIVGSVIISLSDCGLAGVDGRAIYRIEKPTSAETEWTNRLAKPVRWR